MNKELEKLRSALQDAEAERDAARTRAEKALEDARKEGADFSDKAVFDKIDGVLVERDTAIDRVTEIQDMIQRTLEHEAKGGTGPVSAAKAAEDRVRAAWHEDMLDRFEQSPELQRLRSDGTLAPGGTDMPTVRVPAVQVMDSAETRAYLEGRTRAGEVTRTEADGLLWSDRREDMILPYPYRRVRVTDLITVGTTDAETIEYAKEVAPGTGTQDNVAVADFGTALSQSTYEWDKVSQGVTRLGHFIRATKGSLADRGILETLLRTRLDGGMRRKVEQFVVQGSAGFFTGGMLGIDAAPLDMTTGYGTNTLILEGIHKQKTQVEVNSEGLYMAKHLLINPLDYEKILLSKDGNGQYFWGGPVGAPTGTIWGLIPVPTTLISAGNMLVGDFSQVVLWVRQGVQLAASDNVADDFLKGYVVIKAEMRAGAGNLTDLAFEEIINASLS